MSNKMYPKVIFTQEILRDLAIIWYNTTNSLEINVETKNHELAIDKICKYLNRPIHGKVCLIS